MRRLNLTSLIYYDCKGNRTVILVNLNCKSSLKVCTNKCEDNEYANEVTKECKPCASVCQTCKGPAFNQCSSCNAPKVLKDGNCVASCPDGWFASEDNVCKRCDPTCLTCSGKAIFCTACKEDHKLDMNR